MYVKVLNNIPLVLQQHSIYLGVFGWVLVIRFEESRRVSNDPRKSLKRRANWNDPSFKGVQREVYKISTSLARLLILYYPILGINLEKRDKAKLLLNTHHCLFYSFLKNKLSTRNGLVVNRVGYRKVWTPIKPGIICIGGSIYPIGSLPKEVIWFLLKEFSFDWALLNRDQKYNLSRGCADPFVLAKIKRIKSGPIQQTLAATLFNSYIKDPMFEDYISKAHPELWK